MLPQVLVVWLLVINVVTAIAYAWDKTQARRGGRRIPERRLFLLNVLGGFGGAWLVFFGMRHKTQHRSFWLVQSVGDGRLGRGARLARVRLNGHRRRSPRPRRAARAGQGPTGRRTRGAHRLGGDHRRHRRRDRHRAARPAGAHAAPRLVRPAHERPNCRRPPFERAIRGARSVGDPRGHPAAPLPRGSQGRRSRRVARRAARLRGRRDAGNVRTLPGSSPGLARLRGAGDPGDRRPGPARRGRRPGPAGRVRHPVAGRTPSRRVAGHRRAGRRSRLPRLARPVGGRRPTIDGIVEGFGPRGRDWIDGTLFEVDGYLVVNPVHPCRRAVAGATPCPAPPPFLAYDEPLADGMLVSDAAPSWSSRRPCRRSTRTRSSPRARSSSRRPSDDGAPWRVVARYEPSRAVRVLVP